MALNNKKSQWLIAGLMFFIIGIIAVIQLIPVIKDQVTTARSETYLNCTNSANSMGTQMTCLTVDLMLPYFVMAGFVVAAGYLFYTKLLASQ